MTFELSIVTPSKSLLTKTLVHEVFVPAFNGELNILPGHAPLVSTLSEGVLKYRLEGEKKEVAIAISWGYVEVTSLGVDILAETAELKEDIDLRRAEKALKKSDDFLNREASSPEDIEKYHRKRRRAEARITVAKSH